MAHPSQLLAIPDELSDEEATPINCGVATMVAAVEAAALKLGDTTDLSGSLAGRGSYLAADKLWALHAARGETEKATFYATLRDELHVVHKATVST